MVICRRRMDAALPRPFDVSATVASMPAAVLSSAPHDRRWLKPVTTNSSVASAFWSLSAGCRRRPGPWSPSPRGHGRRRLMVALAVGPMVVVASWCRRPGVLVVVGCTASIWFPLPSTRPRPWDFRSPLAGVSIEFRSPSDPGGRRHWLIAHCDRCWPSDRRPTSPSASLSGDGLKEGMTVGMPGSAA
jgi:hypothetical protein